MTVTMTSICYKWLQKLQLQQKVNMLQMGSKWDPNEIQMFQLQQKVTYSRSYLVVTVTVTSICYKWLQKYQLQQKVNILQMGSKWARNGLKMGSKWDPNGIQMESKWDPNGIQMGSKWNPNGIQMF